MYPFKFAVVKKTLNYIDYNKSKNEIIEKITDLSDDNEFIKYVDIKNEESLLPEIINSINPNIEIIYGTKSYIDNYLYQTMSHSLSNIQQVDDSKLNKLGCQFCKGIETYYPVVLTKSKILSDNESEFVSLNKIDVIKYMENIFFKNGVYHKIDNTTEDYTYSQHHFDSLIEKYGNEYVIKNYQYDEIEILDMVLIIISKKEQNENKIKNDLMSRIVNKDIFGEVICCLYIKPQPGIEFEYISLNCDTYFKIIKLLDNEKINTKEESYLNKFQIKNIKNEKYDEKDLLISPDTKINRIFNKYYLNESL